MSSLHHKPPIERVLELLQGLIRERAVVATTELSRQSGPDTVLVEPAAPNACPMGAWLDVPEGAIHVLLGSDQVPYESVFMGRLDVPEILEAALSKLREIFEAVIDGRYWQERVVLLDGTVARIHGVFDLPRGPLRHRVWRRAALLRRQRREIITFAPY